MLQDSSYSNFANKKMMFTHTQKLPSSKAIPKFKGKGLSLAIGDDEEEKKPSKSFLGSKPKPSMQIHNNNSDNEEDSFVPPLAPARKRP